MAETIRTFIAIPLPEHVIEAIGNIQNRIKKTGLTMRWVKPGNIHLTLKFLGDIRPEMVGPITHCMRTCGNEYAPADLSSKGLGVFPGLKRPRVLWTGINGETDLLKAIQKRLDQSLGETGIPNDQRPFKGHLTLGRFKGHPDSKKLMAALKEFADFETGSFSADALHLYKSDLTPQGAVYSVLETISL